MEWFYGNVSTAKPALQQRPEVLDAIGMDLPVNVFHGVIHHFMHELLSKRVLVGRKFIGVYGRTRMHVVENLLLQSGAFHIRNSRCAIFASLTVNHSVNGSLASSELVDAVVIRHDRI